MFVVLSQHAYLPNKPNCMAIPPISQTRQVRHYVGTHHAVLVGAMFLKFDPLFLTFLSEPTLSVYSVNCSDT